MIDLLPDHQSRYICFLLLFDPSPLCSFQSTSDIVHSFGRQLSELEKMVRRMLLESLGVVKHFDRQNSELTFGLRMAKYGALTSQEATVVLPPHVDETTVTLVVQHKVAGLQVLTADGEWLTVPQSPNSYTVLIGQALQVRCMHSTRNPFQL